MFVLSIILFYYPQKQKSPSTHRIRHDDEMAAAAAHFSNIIKK